MSLKKMFHVYFIVESKINLLNELRKENIFYLEKKVIRLS